MFLAMKCMKITDDEWQLTAKEDTNRIKRRKDADIPPYPLHATYSVESQLAAAATIKSTPEEISCNTSKNKADRV